MQREKVLCQGKLLHEPVRMRWGSDETAVNGRGQNRNYLVYQVRYLNTLFKAVKSYQKMEVYKWHDHVCVLGK